MPVPAEPTPTSSEALAAERIEALLGSKGLIGKIAPLSRSSAALYPVPEDLAALLGRNGIPKGWQLGFVGGGAWTTAMRLWASMLGNDGWLALVGVADLGLAALAEQGVRLDRVVVIEPPPGDLWLPVVDALVETFTVVAVGPARVSRAHARRLTSRCRDQGAVISHLAESGTLTWPEPLDCVFDCTSASWSGVDAGSGHLRGRKVEIAVRGRRQAPSRVLSSAGLAVATP